MLEHQLVSMEAVENVQLPEHEPIQETISDVIYHCHICMEAFVCEEVFRIHMDNHTTERPFECRVCGVRFIDEVHLLRHMDLKHGKEEEYEACTVCGKLFHDKMNLRSHMAVHSEKRPFPCELCGKSFKRKGELETHINIHTGVKPHKCSICNKSFTQKYSMKIHMRIHTGEKPFKCSICGKEFNRSSTVTLHMRQHTGEKPYNCTECSESFKLRRDLKNHLAKGHGKVEKPRFRSVPMKRDRKLRKKTKDVPKTKGRFECAICKEEFEYVTVFNAHIQMHDVDSCYLCGQVFKRKGEKRRHVIQPIKLKESKCFTCEVKFSKLEDFKLHMTKHTDLCRLEECLKNAENIHQSSKTSQKNINTLKSADDDTEDEDGNLEVLSDVEEDVDAVGEDCDADENDISSLPTVRLRITPEKNKSKDSCAVTVKPEQHSDDNEPGTKILELVPGDEGFEVKTQNILSLKRKRRRHSKNSTTFHAFHTINASDVDQKPKVERRSPYKVARVSPPRTRGSLKTKVKATPKVGDSLNKVSVSNKSTLQKSCIKNDEDNDDCDLAETYSIYVKNMLRLQPIAKQMSLIKCINDTIGQFIND